MNKVLFLCDQNTCLGPVAAAIFNQMLEEGNRVSGSRQEAWTAFSRGLNVEDEPIPGLTFAALNYLIRHDIDADPEHLPQQVDANDLLWSDRIIALDESRHLPIIEAGIPAIAERIEFWQVADEPNAKTISDIVRLEANLAELLSIIRVNEQLANIR